MKFITLFFLSILLVSCSRKSNKQVSLPIIDQENVIEMEENKIEEVYSITDPFTVMPLFNLKLNNGLFYITTNQGKLLEKIEVPLAEESFIKNKLLRMIYQSSDETLLLSDLFSYSFSVEEKEFSNILKLRKFEDLSSLNIFLSSKGKFFSNKKGTFSFLKYAASISPLDTYSSHSFLSNSPEQFGSFEYGENPIQSYQMKTNKVKLDYFMKEITTNNELSFKFVNFSIDNLSFTEWNHQVLDNGSVLIFLSKEGDRYFFVRDGETVLDCLERNNVGMAISNYFKVNFDSVTSKIKRGEIIALVSKKNTNKKYSKKYQYNTLRKSLTVTKILNRDINLYIQIKGRDHVEKKWFESEIVDMYRNEKVFDHRRCDVRKMRVDIQKERYLNLENELSSYEFIIDGLLIPMDNLIQNNKISVRTIGKIHHIKLKNLSNVNSSTQVEIRIKSSFTNKLMIQDKGRCSLSGRIALRYAGDNAFKEEKFQSFREYSYMDEVGTEKFMNIIYIQ